MRMLNLSLEMQHLFGKVIVPTDKYIDFEFSYERFGESLTLDQKKLIGDYIRTNDFNSNE